MYADGCRRGYITLQARAFRHAFAAGPPLQPLALLDRRARSRRLARRFYTFRHANAGGNRRAPVSGGIGWIEGFKAISDIYCIAEGKFAGGNPALTENIELLGKEPYGAGWLYAIEGKPDSRCMDVHGYVGLLDATIDKMLEKQEYSENA